MRIEANAHEGEVTDYHRTVETAYGETATARAASPGEILCGLIARRSFMISPIPVGGTRRSRAKRLMLTPRVTLPRIDADVRPIAVA